MNDVRQMYLLAPGQLVGAGVGDDQQLLGAVDDVHRAERRRRVHDPDDRVDAVLLEHLLDRRHAGVRPLALVDDDRLDVAAAELVAVLLEPQIPAGLHVLAERGVDAGLRDHEPDLDRPRLLSLAGAAVALLPHAPARAECKCDQDCRDARSHCRLLPAVFRQPRKVLLPLAARVRSVRYSTTMSPSIVR